MNDEADRLRYHIEYALGAPNFMSCKIILIDALTGLAGHPDRLHERALPAWREAAIRFDIDPAEGEVP